jgi:maltose O-acetyltransferase
MPIEFYQKFRVYKYKIFSDAPNVISSARFNQPILLTGQGKISLKKCNLGVWPSPYYLSGYTHIEARNLEAEVIIEDNVYINNNAVIIADRSRITIGKNTLIGSEFTVYDSDFHELHPERRMSGNHVTASVTIGENVFIGSRVTVLKGVTIGRNAIIANGSIVTKNILPNTIVAGIPAKIIGQLNEI